MNTHNKQQIIKFFTMCWLSAICTFYYFYNGGTWLKAVACYFGFLIITKIANIGYHRWLAHNLIEPGTVWRMIILWAITCTAFVKPLNYVVGHRAHHKYSDTDKDPHHTGIGLWNSIIGNFNIVENLNVPVRDIFRKKDVMFVDKHYWKLYFSNLLLFLIIDIDIFLLSFLLLNLRMWLNITIFNYIAHSGKDGSGPVNLPAWTAYVLGYAGEQLHKNHHDNPQRSNFGRESFFNTDVLYHIYKKLVKVKE